MNARHTLCTHQSKRAGIFPHKLTGPTDRVTLAVRCMMMCMMCLTDNLDASTQRTLNVVNIPEFCFGRWLRNSVNSGYRTPKWCPVLIFAAVFTHYVCRGHWQMRSGPWKRREQEVTFHRNGTMSSSDGNQGEWWFDVGGLYWVCVALQARLRCK